MTIEELKNYFGTNLAEIGRQLGLHRSTVSFWVVRNRIPLERQLYIQKFTKGKLRVTCDD